MEATKKQVFIGVSALLLSLFTVYLTMADHPTVRQASVGTFATTILSEITKAELMLRDGSDAALPIYIALDGYVYDVTQGKKFYQPGGVYHYLAGKDSSNTLHIMGGETIKQKYPIIGILVEKHR